MDCVSPVADCRVMDCELKMAVEVNFALKTLNYILKVDIPAVQGSTDYIYVWTRPWTGHG